MICPKCGRPVEENAVICRGCEFILDTEFLGDGILDEEHSLRPGAGGVDPASFNLADAVILGNIDDISQSFETSDSGFHVRPNTAVRFYVSGRSQAAMAPDAIPALVSSSSADGVRLTPFEKHVLAFIDGKRPVEIIRKRAGLDESEVKTALATLADKGVIKVVGRALVEFDENLDTAPGKQNKRRVRGSMVGAVAIVGDAADLAIEDAFRTQVGLSPLSPEQLAQMRPPPRTAAGERFAAAGLGHDSNLPSDADDVAFEDLPGTDEIKKRKRSEGTGLKNADAINVARPGKNGTGKKRAAVASAEQASLPEMSADKSDGFDDFGEASDLSTAVARQLRASQSSSVSDVSAAEPGRAPAPHADSFSDFDALPVKDDVADLADSRVQLRPNFAGRPPAGPRRDVEVRDPDPRREPPPPQTNLKLPPPMATADSMATSMPPQVRPRATPGIPPQPQRLQIGQTGQTGQTGLREGVRPSLPPQLSPSARPDTKRTGIAPSVEAERRAATGNVWMEDVAREQRERLLAGRRAHPDVDGVSLQALLDDSEDEPTHARPPPLPMRARPATASQAVAPPPSPDDSSASGAQGAASGFEDSLDGSFDDPVLAAGFHAEVTATPQVGPVSPAPDALDPLASVGPADDGGFGSDDEPSQARPRASGLSSLLSEASRSVVRPVVGREGTGAMRPPLSGLASSPDESVDGSVSGPQARRGGDSLAGAAEVDADDSEEGEAEASVPVGRAAGSSFRSSDAFSDEESRDSTAAARRNPPPPPPLQAARADAHQTARPPPPPPVQARPAMKPAMKPAGAGRGAVVDKPPEKQPYKQPEKQPDKLVDRAARLVQQRPADLSETVLIDERSLESLRAASSLSSSAAPDESASEAFVSRSESGRSGGGDDGGSDEFDDVETDGLAPALVPAPPRPRPPFDAPTGRVPVGADATVPPVPSGSSELIDEALVVKPSNRPPTKMVGALDVVRAAMQREAAQMAAAEEAAQAAAAKAAAAKAAAAKAAAPGPTGPQAPVFSSDLSTTGPSEKNQPVRSDDERRRRDVSMSEEVSFDPDASEPDGRGASSMAADALEETGAGSVLSVSSSRAYSQGPSHVDGAPSDPDASVRDESQLESEAASNDKGDEGGEANESTVNVDMEELRRRRAAGLPDMPARPKAGAAAVAIPSGFSQVLATDGEQSALSRPADPKPVSFEMQRKARMLFEEAQKAQAQGQLSAARMNAKLATIYDPNNVSYRQLFEALEAPPPPPTSSSGGAARPEYVKLYEEAQRLEVAGEYDDAISLLVQGTKEFPQQAAFHNRLGVILALKRRDFDRAAVAIQRAIELEPDNLHYKSNLGKVLQRKNVNRVGA